MDTVLFWFRRDLRTRDNVGLMRARERATRLLTIFTIDPSHSDWKHRCGDRLHFKLESIQSLRGKIRDQGGNLLVRLDSPGTVIPHICNREDVDSVFWNRCYEPYERKRDDKVRSALDEIQCSYKTFKDQVIFEKKEILTNKSSPYKVFTHYANKWKSRPKPESVDEVFEFGEPNNVPPGDIPSVKKVGLERHLESIDWEPDQDAAHTRWHSFKENKIENYETDRNFPARHGTSKLSPYLRFGLISPRKLVYDSREEIKNGKSKEDVETFIEEIIWRDFYQQILYNFPHVVDENFKPKYDELEWENHPKWFEAWKNGRTGYPIVDAAMRQLNQIGWMHNRLRMIVASFLTKDCFIHWKKGEKYFMNRLIDGDTGSNNGGWQWASSTGTDAAPYFRIFNPISQSEQYDPEGEFIRNYCPELESLDNDNIHAPFQAEASALNDAEVKLGEDYPKPILDHQERRKIALEKFEGF